MGTIRATQNILAVISRPKMECDHQGCGSVWDPSPFCLTCFLTDVDSHCGAARNSHGCKHYLPSLRRAVPAFFHGILTRFLVYLIPMNVDVRLGPPVGGCLLLSDKATGVRTGRPPW